MASDLASTTVAAIISGKACQFCNGCVMGGRLREGVRFYPQVTYFTPPYIPFGRRIRCSCAQPAPIMQLLLINKMFLRTHKSPVGNPCQLSRSIRYFCHARHLVLNNSNFCLLNKSYQQLINSNTLRLDCEEYQRILLLVEIGKSQPMLFELAPHFPQSVN